MITAEQREARRRYIGSSDAAAIMGLDPYRSAADVWLEKTGRVESGKGNDATEAGTILERAVLDWAERDIAFGFNRDVFHAAGNRCANLDAVVSNAPEIVEAKTTGIVGPADPGYGEPGTDDLPERVLIQIHHQFAVIGPEYRVAWVPVLIGGVGFRMYRVERSDELAEVVAEAAEKFWVDFVRENVEPSDFRPSIEVLKKRKRLPVTAHVPEHLGENLIVTRAARLQAEKDEEQAAAALLIAMGDAEAADFGDGRIIQYRECHRKAYMVEASTYRRWQLPKSKQAKAIERKDEVSV